MKKIFPSLSLLIFCLTLTFATQAQNQLNCNEGPAEHTVVLNPPLCYPKADYDSSYFKILEQFEKDLLTMVTCINNCPIPDLFECHPEFVRFTQGGPLIETDTDYCFGGTVKFEWKCSPCRRINDVETEPENEEAPGENDGELQNEENGHSSNYNFSPLQNISHTKNLGAIKEIYPNPMSDFFFANILVEQENSQVVLEVYDLSGQLVFDKMYEQVPRSIFNTRNTLTKVTNGIYILNVKINQQLVGTSKLTVQRK